ncbi:unnamed protein product [Moneuplotes crassus]|uniref:Enoyl reductase (ER) domain-containing protein n=2 Tax=Euplotes crassus TaxID=5936 RepID=A0AAD1XLY5_EUPCR|nr:unnamed protein product [Moneuplotes crassus]
MHLWSKVSRAFGTARINCINQKEHGDVSTLFHDQIDFPGKRDKEVYIKIEATAVNRAEILQRRGLYPPIKGATKIIGLEGAGYLCNSQEEYLSGGYKNNSRIMALLEGGGYSDIASVHKDHIIPIPENLSFTEAAAIPETWLTSYQLLNLVANARKGDYALIHAAASGIGCAAIQICKMQGVKPIAVASSQAKLDHSIELGAVAGINYKETPDFSESVKEYTNGKGTNIILDCIGAQNFDYNVKSAAMDCQWVLYGAMGGVRIQNVNLGPLLAKRIQFLSSTLKSRTNEYKAKLVQKFSEDCIPGFESGELKPIVDSVTTLSKVADAHTRMEANLNIGKIVMVNDL